MLLHYETTADAQAAAFQLQSLGRAACRLLEQCVEAQALKRTPVEVLALIERMSRVGQVAEHVGAVAPQGLVGELQVLRVEVVVELLFLLRSDLHGGRAF